MAEETRDGQSSELAMTSSPTGIDVQIDVKEEMESAHSNGAFAAGQFDKAPGRFDDSLSPRVGSEPTRRLSDQSASKSNGSESFLNGAEDSNGSNGRRHIGRKRVSVATAFMEGVKARYYLIVGSLCIFVVWTLLTILFESRKKSLQNTLFSGGALSFLSCAFVIYSYHRVPSFQAHPNRIIYWKSWFDLAIGVRFLLQPLYQSLGPFVADGADDYNFKDESDKCLVLSVITQFLLMGSETLYFMLSVDLYFALSNPFTSFTSIRKRYYLVTFFVSAVTAILIGVLSDRVDGERRYAYGLFMTYSEDGIDDDGNLTKVIEGGFCWFRQEDDTTESSDGGGIFEPNSWNPYALGLYQVLTGVYIFGAIIILFWALLRMQQGLNQTFEVRKGVIQNCFVYTLVISGYFLIWFILYYVWFSIEGTASARIWVLKLLAFILSGRGYTNFLVWVQTNDPRKMQKFVLGLGTFCCPRLMNDRFGNILDDAMWDNSDVDYNSRVAVNTALQSELKAFVSAGILQALKKQSRRNAPVQARRTRKLMSRASDSRLIMSMASLMGDQNNLDNDLEPANDDFTEIILHEETARVDFKGFFQSACSCFKWQRDTEPGRESAGPSKISEQVQFIDYRPITFGEIRKTFGISPPSYQKGISSIGKVSISEGASGAFMMFTNDKKYIIKSCSKEEMTFLSENADAFKKYYTENPDTLLCRFYGLHRIRLYEQSFHFVVMENLFLKEKINFRYDIKGSWVKRSGDLGRESGPQKRVAGRGLEDELFDIPGVLKDNDLRYPFKINKGIAVSTYHTLKSDSDFLRDLGIMDYSLLVGVQNGYYNDARSADSMRTSSSIQATPMHSGVEPVMMEGTACQTGFREVEQFVGPQKYYIGVIDILQEWNFGKRMEAFFKVRVLQKDKKGISAVEPKWYAERFQLRMKEVLQLDDMDVVCDSDLYMGVT